MAARKFDKPACKLHIKDVFLLERKDGCWNYCEGNILFPVHLVWLQGKVISYSQDKSEVTLQEDGSNLTILKCDSIPGGNSWITQGQYVMAVGEIDQNASKVNVLAVKMADLSDNQLNPLIWKHEVMEIKVASEVNIAVCR